MQTLSDAGGWKTLLDRFSHYHFPPARLKPAAGNQLQVVAHFETGRRDTAEGYVNALRRVDAGKINDCDHLERRHGLPGT